MTDLQYADGIAAERTMIVLEANPTALQRRLPSGWELAPYAGDDLRGTSLRGANLLVPFHEVYAVRSDDGQPVGLPQLSYVPFVSQAREQATGEVAHMHWLTYTEDPAGVPGKYDDGALAQITRSRTFSKQRRGETHVRETFSALADRGEVHLSLAYEQGGDLVIWASPDKPNLALRAARNPSIVRWYQEDQVMNVVRSDPLNVDRVTEISLDVKGELEDVFDGERIVAVVIQRPYMRRVYVPDDPSASSTPSAQRSQAGGSVASSDIERLATIRNSSLRSELHERHDRLSLTAAPMSRCCVLRSPGRPVDLDRYAFESAPESTSSSAMSGPASGNGRVPWPRTSGR